MAYEDDRWQILAAAAEASAAAVVLAQYPLARNIALMIGSIVSDPREILKASVEWVTPTQAAGAAAFETMLKEVSRLQKKAEEDSIIKGGPAAQALNESLELFVEQLKVAQNYYKGVGDGVENISTLYHFAVEVAVWAATALGIAAIWHWQSFIVPVWGQVVMKGAVVGLLVSVGQVLRSMLGKNVKAVAVLGGIMLTVNAMCATLTQAIDKNRPKPDFAPAALKYVANEDTKVGTLQPKNTGISALGSGQMPGMKLF